MSLAAHLRAFVLLCALTPCLLWYTPAQAASDPERTWFTIETAHFAIHAYDDGRLFAERVARYAEEAYSAINPLLGWTPEERVHIRLVDDVDAANGFASVTPYNGITLLAFPPPMGSELSYSDDWLRVLIFHEYSHIVHLDNATGVPRFLNSVFGKVLKPNLSLPRWFAEGVATWVETHLSQGGRVGSPHYEMVLRTAALADDMPTIDAITGPPLKLPRATSWYLYGSALIDYMVRHAGVDALRAYLRAYGRRLIPYAMNTLARQHTGKDLAAWWKGMVVEVKARALAMKEKVETQGRVEGRALTTSGEYKSHPRFNREGSQLLYVRSDGRSEERLVMAPLDALDEARTVAHCDGGCGPYALSHKGERVFMTTMRAHRHVNWYSDLVEFSLVRDNPRGSGRRITRGARFGDPSASPQGADLWGVSTRWGETTLQVVEPESGRMTKVWSPPPHARLDRPILHPDKKRVFASLHHASNRDLIELRLADKSWRRLTHGAAMERDLTLSADGKWLVYVSDLGGVDNLFARDVSGDPSSEGRVFQLTNVLSGASQPTISPDDSTLVYVGWTPEGEQLYSMPFAPEQGQPLVAGDGTTPRAAIEPLTVKMSAPQDYTPLSTLLPRSWAPSFAYDTTGVTRLGLRLGGVDITRRLSAGLAFGWDVGLGELSALASLGIGYGLLDFDLTLGRYAHDVEAHYDDQPQPYRQEVFHARIGMHYGIPHPIVATTLSLDFSVEVFRGLRHAEITHSPDELTPIIPREGGTSAFRLAWSFDTSRRDVWSISKNRGGEGSLSLRFRLPGFGAEGANFDLTYRLRRYLTMPWHEEHVLCLGLQGGFSGGSSEEVETFDVGGVPRQDIVSALMSRAHAGPVWLRGFVPSAFAASAYHLASVEYRFPLFRLRRGLDTLPVFARDLSAALFSDGAWTLLEGDAWDLRPEDIHVGIGAELRLTTDLLFGFKAHFRLGYAYGFGPGGVHHVYFLLAPDP